MNTGVKRGVGLPGGIAPSPQIWGKKGPLSIVSTPGAGAPAQFRGISPIPYWFQIEGAPQNKGVGGIGVAINDVREVPQTIVSSGIAGDNSSALKVWVQPKISPNATDFGMNGISVGGFIGYPGNGQVGGTMSGPTSLTGNGRFAAYACHWDTGVPAFGLYGFVAHLGLLGSGGAMVAEMVAFDINAMNSFGASALVAVGYRMLSSTQLVATSSSPFGLMIGMPTGSVNQIRGPVALGGGGDYFVPAAQVDVQNTVALGGNPGTPILSLTDTPASGSPLIRKTFRQVLDTTNGSPTNMWVSPVLNGGLSRWLFKFTLMGRQTGGSGGAVGQGAAWTWTVGINTETGSAVVDGATTPTLTGSLPTGWAAPTNSIFAGACLVPVVQGAANENVTWHLEVEQYGPLTT